ncbi:hypothetical protein [Phytohabitans kaempferiae]|uniref:PE domain-containing protein n=1 Tax=Phytohabitans kaempferiae TaxID=1620943 RepID=A0ABV6MF46_9ACTN
MIDEVEVEVRRDLSRAAHALDEAAKFLASYDAAHATLLGMAAGWESPLALTLRDGRQAVDRVAAYVHALAGEPATGEPSTGESLNGVPVRRMALLSHGDPGE